MGLLAFESVKESRNLSVTSAALRQASRERDALLDQLRTDFYHSATVVRDYLTEPDDARATIRAAELKLLHVRVRTLLDRYQAASPAVETQDVETLRRKFESYWAQLSPALAWSRGARRDLAEPFLQGTVMPTRDDLVAIVKQVNELDRRDLDAAEERIRAAQSRVAAANTTLSVVALLAGAVLALIVLRHMRHLEQEADVRLHEAEAARTDLRRLSDRLVTAQEEERRSLSRELHDDLGQAMSAMLIELGALDSAPDQPARHERLVSVRRMAEEIVSKVRNMALLLRPSMLDELGLIAALRWHAREVTRRTGLKVKMVADDLDDQLPDSLRTGVFRIVQEALNNCVRHAKASDVRVVIAQTEGELSVLIEDNGVGFDVVRDKGLGILGMAERVDRLGGRLNIQSQPGHGATIAVSFSLRDSRHLAVEAGVS